MSLQQVKRRLGILPLLAIIAVVPPLAAQDDPSEDQTPRAKAKRVIAAAIEALGGDAYLNVKTVHNHGNWFQFNRHGQRSPLVKYWEFVEFDPVKWYFQLAKGGRQRVQVYNLEVGRAWSKEGKGHVEELDSKEVEQFRKGIRHDIDILLRQRTHAEDESLFYYGPDEITGGDGTYEAVEFLNEANDAVVVYFDLKTRLPVRMEYQGIDKMGNRFKVSNEFYNYHVINGVNVALRLDIYRMGKLAEQRHLIEVQVNPPLDQGQFLAPPVEGKKNKKK